MKQIAAAALGLCLAAAPARAAQGPARADPMRYDSGRVGYGALPDFHDDDAREIPFGWPPGPEPRHPDPRGVLHLYAGPRPKAPFILVLPMTGDPDYRVSRSFCRYFSRNGLRCAYLERVLPDDEDLPKTLDGLFKLPGLPPYSSMAARRSLDVLQAMGVLAPGEKVGIAGVSMGAIDAAIVGASDPRVGALALLLGGGDVPLILSNIHGLGVEIFAAMRERQMRLNGWTAADFLRVMTERTWASDPLTYLRDRAWLDNKSLSGSDVLMMNVSGDTAIPKRASDELYEAFRALDGSRPAYEILNVGFLPKPWRHVGAMTRIFYARKRMVKHFQSVLGGLPGAQKQAVRP